MTTIAEKFAEAKRCCRESISRKAEEARKFYDGFFTGTWKEFVIKKEESTGKLMGKKAGCAGCPV